MNQSNLSNMALQAGSLNSIITLKQYKKPFVIRSRFFVF